MTIGLLCLGTVALLIFFGVAQKTLKEIGIPEWVAFVFVLALVIGVVMPSLQFGNVYLSISGFLLPLVCCALLFAVIGIKKELLSVLIATLAIAASTMIVKFLLPVSLNEFVSLQCLLIGLCGGLFACLFAKKRTAALLSSILGILLGDALVALIHMYAYHFVFVSIGSDGIFDAIVLSSLLGVVLVALVENMRVAQQQRRQTSKALLIEAAEDFDLQKKQEKKERKMARKLARKQKYDTNINMIVVNKYDENAEIAKENQMAQENYQTAKEYLQKARDYNAEMASEAWMKHQNINDELMKMEAKQRDQQANAKEIGYEVQRSEQDNKGGQR